MTATHPYIETLRKAGLINTPTAPADVGAVSPTLMSTEKITAYAAAALAGEIDNVRRAGEGTRNATLNRAAWKLGRLVADGHLDEQHVTTELTAAATATGLPLKEINGTVPRAITDGGGIKRYEPKTSREPTGQVIGDAYTLNGDATDATATAGDPDPWGHLNQLNWHDLWADDTEQEWVVEPLIPLRRIVALYSPAKAGKSLLMLELAAAVAAGREVFGQQVTARVVLYVDFENDPRDDIRTRLISMGYGPEDLDNLVYLSYPTLSALDSDKGGRELLAAVEHYGAEVVVIDTISRAVDGEENENDTWLKAYRHTLLRLKQAGVTAVRLDHTGKDEERGQRGGSAKTGDVDAVWKLSVIDDMQIRVHCEIARMPVPEHDFILIREELPHLHHRIDRSSLADQFEGKVAAVMAALDMAGLDAAAGRKLARKAISTTGVTASNSMLDTACKRRQSAAATTHWQDR